MRAALLRGDDRARERCDGQPRAMNGAHVTARACMVRRVRSTTTTTTRERK
jgi:hypothetical protein